jgi:GDPmannose 4,6-dehydratase
MNNIAFITGITGQDGSYLAELLMEKGYVIHGLIHRPDRLSSSYISKYIKDEAIINKRLFLHNGSYDDSTHLRRIIAKAKPSEFYHLAGQSSPRVSLEMPESTMESIGMGTLRILEILRDLQQPPKFLFASSSEVFGTPLQMPQTEETPMNPATPYGAAKALSQHLCKIYRIAYGLQTCSAILYNHESPRRGSGFVTKKIAAAVAAIKLGIQKELQLGSLTGQRDWGWAPDYVMGMYLMLQQPIVDDFLFATGKLHSVQQLVEMTFKSADLDWRDYVKYDHTLVTAVEPLAACGYPEKAKRILGWESSINLEEIMSRIVKSELANLSQKLNIS